MRERRTKRRTPNRAVRHEAIARDLAGRFAKGEWPLGKRIPSFRQFAKQYRVSLGTVQRAFETLKTDGWVRVTPDRPTLAALGASLSTVTQDAVALVLTNDLSTTLRSGWYREIWLGIQNGVGKSGRSLLVLQHPRRWRHEYPAGLGNLPLKGILLLGPFSPNLLRQYEAMPHPVVLLDQPGAGYNLQSIALANYEAAFEATTRMIASGHRQIAFLRRLVWSLRDIDPDSKERQEGFVDACKKRGLRESQYRILTTSAEDPGIAAKDIARSAPRITAIFAVDDVCAAQTAEVAGAAGLNVPRDLSIVTIPSTLSSRNWSGPRVDTEQLGRKGVEMLFRKRGALEHLRIRPVWHDGDSFGPAKHG